MAGIVVLFTLVWPLAFFTGCGTSQDGKNKSGDRPAAAEQQPNAEEMKQKELQRLRRLLCEGQVVQGTLIYKTERGAMKSPGHQDIPSVFQSVVLKYTVGSQTYSIIPGKDKLPARDGLAPFADSESTVTLICLPHDPRIRSLARDWIYQIRF